MRRRVKKRRWTDPQGLLSPGFKESGRVMIFTDYPDWLLARMHGVRFIVEY